MHNSPECLSEECSETIAPSVMGRFGLIRLLLVGELLLCSKKCVDRFKARQKGDPQMVRRLQNARQTVAVRVAVQDHETALAEVPESGTRIGT